VKSECVIVTYGESGREQQETRIGDSLALCDSEFDEVLAFFADGTQGLIVYPFDTGKGTLIHFLQLRQLGESLLGNRNFLQRYDLESLSTVYTKRKV